VLSAACATPEIFEVISPLPCAASHASGHFIRRGVLLFDGGSDGVRDVIDLPDDIANGADRRDGSLGVRLNRLDLAADVLRGLRGFPGKLFYFVGDDGEAFSRFSGAGRFDGGV